ncbi:urokinase plasminogen activator surface receptor-like [Garra rufa]|uniref:urokinase plasminogen activator surface receptor-like n=1 Tax=Garra rufa TaxID=137080 RepID=UPI003CCE68EF
MDVQFTVFLLFILFTAGHSLKCYECASADESSCTAQKVTTCPDGLSKCLSSVSAAQIGNKTTKMKFKGCVTECQSSSFNFGTTMISSSCCDTDLCNANYTSDPSTDPNGKKCYYCNGQNCSNILTCAGSQDRCITATVNLPIFGGQSHVYKGCVPESICDAMTSTYFPHVQEISCCEGDLCNGAQSVTQSFLFLCCSLLSFILLH